MLSTESSSRLATSTSALGCTISCAAMMLASVEAPVSAMLLPTTPTSVASVVLSSISELRFHSVVSMMTAQIKMIRWHFRDFCVINCLFFFLKKGQYCPSYLEYDYSVQTWKANKVLHFLKLELYGIRPIFFFTIFVISKIRVITAWFEICSRNNVKNLKKFIIEMSHRSIGKYRRFVGKYTTGNYLKFNLMAYGVCCLIHGRLCPFFIWSIIFYELIYIRATPCPATVRIFQPLGFRSVTLFTFPSPLPATGFIKLFPIAAGVWLASFDSNLSAWTF